jgi:hypothetical protein
LATVHVTHSCQSRYPDPGFILAIAVAAGGSSVSLLVGDF